MGIETMSISMSTINRSDHSERDELAALHGRSFALAHKRSGALGSWNGTPKA
jgi:hypothetical protein